MYGAPGFTAEQVAKAKKELVKKIPTVLSAATAEKISAALEGYFGCQEVMDCPDLNAQITKINYALWPKLFKTNGVNAPELVYVEIETLVSKLLCENHVLRPDSLIYKFIFDPRSPKLIKELFEGIPGAFSAQKDWGTYLFWGMDPGLHRVRLFLNSAQLHSQHHMYSLPFTPEALQAALKSKQIFPSMMLCYVVVALYYGMKCLGGFSQVNDLTQTKAAWQEFLQCLGFPEEAQAVEPVQTKELGGDGMVLSYIQSPSGETVPSTGIDLLLCPEHAVSDYVALAKKVTLRDMMLPLLPEIYAVLFPQAQRDPELAAITVQQIMSQVHLLEKLR